MKIAVFGLGKIGLPLAVQYARMGHHVVGVDTNTEVVQMVHRGEEPFPGERHLADYLVEAVATHHLSATTDGHWGVASADAIVVAVPLYVDQEARPDFSAIDAVAAVIGDAVRAGTLVSFETTLPVGTTRNRIAPEIERRSGLGVGTEVHLVFSPERVLTGRVFADLRRYPKLVGGVSEASEDAGVAFYQAVLEFDERPDLTRPNGVWRMGSAEAAEMAKLAETTYRDVNIALANQFALFAEEAGVDVYAVIEACNSQPYSNVHNPGVAVGGHCIPIYPHLYIVGDPAATVVRAAREANAAMPSTIVARISEELGTLEGKTVLVLGIAYRGGVKEAAFSGVFPIRDACESLGAVVLVDDPLFSEEEVELLGLRPYLPGTRVDLVIIQAAHDEYRVGSFIAQIGAPLIYDGRNVLAELGAPPPGVRVLGRGGGDPWIAGKSVL